MEEKFQRVKFLILDRLANLDKSSSMKSNHLNSNYVILIAIVAIISQVVQGQNKIKWEEIPSLAQKIKDEVPEGKALFVFEAQEDFQFDSDNENIVQPIKDGLLYKLMIDIEPPSGALSIKHEGIDDVFINYGKFNFAGSLPALKSKEIKYFRLSLTTVLVCYDETRKKNDEGATDFQALNLLDALIIFNVVPNNLDLMISGNEITKIIPEAGRFKVYVKPTDQEIILSSKNYDNVIIKFNDLETKDVRYFHVEKPLLNRDVESFDPNTKVGNYSIESMPAGAIIQMTGNPDFNKLQHTTPYTIEDYKAGTEIITLTLERFESIKDTILISSTKGKKSKYNLIPKFAFINCYIEPPIPTSKVVMDGKELPLIENGKDYECPKGNHNIEINAPHYYSETRQISLVAGRISEVNVKLKPKMGSLSINTGINSSGAEVIINDKIVGEIPMTNIPLQEGSYEVRFKKSNFISEKSVYIIEVSENKLTDFKDLKMVNTQKVHITTSPVTGATVYIDNKQLSDRTNLNVTLGIGEHSIKIEVEHYKPCIRTFTVDQGHDEFNFELEELSYPVSFNTKPSYSYVYIDGISKGQTPLKINLPLGSYTVRYKRDNFLRKMKTISISEPTTIDIKLFPGSYWILGADYGLDQYRFNIGYVVEGILFSIGLQYNANSNSIDANELAIENVIVDDINQYDKEYARIYDSTKVSFNVKLGFTIKKPIVFLITAGCSFIQTDKFQKVYKAKHDYIAQYSGGVIYKGDLFSEPFLTKNTYTAITAGIMLPIARTIYLSAEYYTNSDIGPGFSFGLGFMLGTKLRR
jgi:hypothetical protein